jgi:ubiquinone/menaquinone biosynthesis C-methylase UbiE
MTWNPQTAYQDSGVASSYDAARFTSWSGRKGHARERSSFVRALARAQGVRTALDVPCGTGRMTSVLLERGLSTVGLDISLQMIAQAERKVRGQGTARGLVRGSILQMPFRARAFDVVTCVRLFGHFAAGPRVAMLREMARVSREYVVVQYFCETAVTRLKRWVRRQVLRTYEGVGHPLVRTQIDEELRASGLQIVDCFWCWKHYAEEVFVVARKVQPS